MFSVRSRILQSRSLTTIGHYSEFVVWKSPARLVAQLRRVADVPIAKAREALAASDNDVEKALEWLQKDLGASAAAKAAKVQGRVAKEGAIGVCVLSRGIGPTARGAIVELNCETDFVGRNSLFAELVDDIAFTAAFLAKEPQEGHNISVEELLDAPLLSRSKPALDASPSSIGDSIMRTISSVGEKISLKRYSAVVDAVQDQRNTAIHLVPYVHGSTTHPSQGRIGALLEVSLRSSNISQLVTSPSFLPDLEKLERSLARQYLAYGGIIDAEFYKQPFSMLVGGSESSVEEVLKSWSRERGFHTADDISEETVGIQISKARKWTVGEPLESE